MPGSALSDLSSLVGLARERDLDMRPVILRVQTDLFATARTRDRATVAAFESLASGLLAAVDDDTAAIVARKLAPIAETPESLLLLLVMRGGEACRAVIEHAPVLSELVLAAAAADETDIAAFTAARAGLDATMVADLAAREDSRVDLALARNPRLMLSGATLDALVERARSTPALAAALLDRELPAGHAAALYLHADEGRRAAIRTGVAALAAARAKPLRLPSPEACAELVELAEARAALAFGARLAGMLRLDPTPRWDFGREEHQDLLPLALLAAGVGEEDAIRILLTLEPAIALFAQKVFRLVRLFRDTPRATAAHLVEAVIGASAPRAGRHVPYVEASDRTTRAGSFQQIASDADVVRVTSGADWSQQKSASRPG
ncbi:MAG TPA: DUF2336 domain-containing protein [Beijerinckiaceae bacterium]|jgi:hypothetical protein